MQKMFLRFLALLTFAVSFAFCYIVTMKFFEFFASVFMLCVAVVCIPVAFATRAAKAYAKKLNWFVLIGIALFCIILAVVNNIRVGEGKSVEWIGTQDVMEKPAVIL